MRGNRSREKRNKKRRKEEKGEEGNGIASVGPTGGYVRKWREEVSYYRVITRNNVDLMCGFKYRL